MELPLMLMGTLAVEGGGYDRGREALMRVSTCHSSAFIPNGDAKGQATGSLT